MESKWFEGIDLDQHFQTKKKIPWLTLGPALSLLPFQKHWFVIVIFCSMILLLLSCLYVKICGARLTIGSSVSIFIQISADEYPGTYGDRFPYPAEEYPCIWFFLVFDVAALNEALTGEVQRLRISAAELGGEGNLSNRMSQQLSINQQMLQLQQLNLYQMQQQPQHQAQHQIMQQPQQNRLPSHQQNGNAAKHESIQ